MNISSNSVLITGTTSGLGRSLLEYYARRDVKVIAVNRRAVPELESKFPSVHFECVDVRVEEQVTALISRLVERAALPNLLFLNAGINRVDNDMSFDMSAYKDVLATNLYGVLHFIQPLTQLPKTPTTRRVIAISSMANYIGNPYGLGYFTSKRALTASFDVWSKMYAGTDLVFQQVMLGPIRTNIHTMNNHLPVWIVRIKGLFSASSEASARAIAHFALSRKKKLFYPWPAVPLYLGIWVIQLVIPGFFRGRKTLGGKLRRPAESSDRKPVDDLKV